MHALFHLLHAYLHLIWCPVKYMRCHSTLLTLIAQLPDYSSFTYSVLWAVPGPIRILGLPCTSVFNFYFNRPIVIAVTNSLVVAKQILKSRLWTGNNQFYWLPGQGYEISDHMSHADCE